MIRYEFVEGASSKFWQYEVRHTELVIEYGRLGGKPLTSTKTFDTEEEARRAADKLVKEKTGKGYVAVFAEEGHAGTPTEPTPPVTTKTSTSTTEPAPPVTTKTSTSTTFRTFQKEVDLTKVRMRSGEDDHGPGQWPRILWAVVEAGLLKKADAFAALKALSNTAELGTPAALLSALSAQPSKLKEGASVQLLENYTLGMDALLMHLAHRAPEVLQQNERALPPNIRRAIPLVRARLGSGAVLDRSFMDEFARSYAHDYAQGEPLVMLRDGKLVNERIDTGTSARDLAAFYGDIDEWQQKVRAAAILEGGAFKYWSRTEAFFIGASVEEVSRLIGHDFFANDHAREVLEQRADGADDLIQLLALQTDQGEARCNIIAALAAIRCRAEGKAIPPAVARCLTFEVPYGQADTYITTLRALGEDAVAAKRKRFAASSDGEVRDRAAVALAAFYDDKAFRKLLAHKDVTDQDARSLALVGKAGLDALSEALAASEEGERRHRFLAKAFLGAAARAFQDSGFILEADPEAGDADLMKVLLSSWPVDRRRAWLKACFDKTSDERVVLDHAEFATDELLDAALAELMKMDSDSVLANCDTLEAGGAVVERALLRMLPRRKGEKKLLQLLDWMRLSSATRDEVNGIVFGGAGEAFVALANDERVFCEAAAAALLVGKPFTGPFTLAGVRSLCASLDKMAQELRLQLAIAIAADVWNTDEGQNVRAVIGIEVQRAVTAEPQSIEASALANALQSAKALLWNRVQEALPAGWSIQDEAGVCCVASGPLAVAKIAVGKLVDGDGDGDGDYDDLICGSSMDQEEKTTAVRGKLIASSSYDAEPIVRVELPPLTRAAKKNAAFLIASYDY